jgi:thiol:disulfide interchange protein
MKSLLLIAAGITLVILVASGFTKAGKTEKSESGIQFHKGTWSEALALAKKENKLVFLDISASWCGPCKSLKANTFTDSKVGEYYNSTFINVEVDGEKGEGATLARQYGVRAYPTLLFINPNGDIVQGTAGYHNPKQFLELGQSITKKINAHELL